MGIPLPTPMSYVRPLARVMRTFARECEDEKFDIVAHSIGGVMIREVLRRQPGLADKVGRIVTLGSPHHGTAVVRWMRFGPIYKMLALDSQYLQELADFRVLAPHSFICTFGSLHDLVVYPVDTCHLDGARNVTMKTISHLGLLTQPRIFDEIESALHDSASPLESLDPIR